MTFLCPVPLPGIQTAWWFTTSAVKTAACVQQSSETAGDAGHAPSAEHGDLSKHEKHLCENGSPTRRRRKRQSGYSTLSICLSLSFQCNGKDHTSVRCSASKNHGQWDLIQIYEVHYSVLLLSPEKHLSRLFPFPLYLQCTLSSNMTLCPMHLVERLVFVSTIQAHKTLILSCACRCCSASLC